MKWMLERARSGGGDQGGALVVVLVTVVAFGLLLGSVLSLTTTSAQSVGLLGEQSQGRVDAESAHELATMSLRKSVPAGPGTVCDPSTLAVTDGGSSSTVSCTTRVEASASSATSDTTVLTTGNDSSDGIVLESGATPTINGNVWSNKSIRGSGVLSATGDVATLGSCLVTITETNSSDGAVCDAASALPVRTVPATNPALPTNVPALPACPTDARNTLVAFEPGVYRDAKALNDLFAACAGRDFWFKPGTYLFDFVNTEAGACSVPAASGEDTSRRLCLNANGTSASRISAGTPQGWDPSTSGSKVISSSWRDVSNNFASFPDPEAALQIDDRSSRIDLPGTNFSTIFVKGEATGDSSVTTNNLGNALLTNGAWAGRNFPVGKPSSVVTHNATTATSTDFTSPQNARVIDDGATPAVAEVNVAAGATARISLTGFSSSTTAIERSTLRVRVKGADGTNRALLTPGNGPGCAPVDVVLGAPDANGYRVGDIDVSSCLPTPEAINGASVGLEVTAGAEPLTVVLDGAALSSTVLPVSYTGGIRYTDVTPFDAKGRNEVVSINLAVTHAQSQLGMKPRMVIDGGRCSYNLTEGTSLHTDVIDVTACAGTLAGAKALTVDVLATSVEADKSHMSFDGIEIRVVFPTTMMTTRYEIPLETIPDNFVSLEELRIQVKGTSRNINSSITLKRPPASTCGNLFPKANASFSYNYNWTPCAGDGTETQKRSLQGMYLLIYSDDANSSAQPYLSMDGAGFRITYRVQVQRIPALGAGSSCATTGTAPGVSFVFKGDSRMVLDSGSAELCGASEAGSPEKRTAITAVSAGGCVLGGSCSLLTTGTGATGSQLSVQGGILSPEGRVRVGADSINAPLVTQGVVARSLTVHKYGLATGYSGPWITNTLQDDRTAFSTPLTSRSPRITERLESVVSFGPLVKGRPTKVTSWEWKR